MVPGSSVFESRTVTFRIRRSATTNAESQSIVCQPPQSARVRVRARVWDSFGLGPPELVRRADGGVRTWYSHCPEGASSRMYNGISMSASPYPDLRSEYEYAIAPAASYAAVCTPPSHDRKVITAFRTGSRHSRSRSVPAHSPKKCRFRAGVAMIDAKFTGVSGPMSTAVSRFALTSAGRARARFTFARIGVCAPGQSSPSRTCIGLSSLPRSRGGSEDMIAATITFADGSPIAAPSRRISALRSMPVAPAVSTTERTPSAHRSTRTKRAHDPERSAGRDGAILGTVARALTVVRSTKAERSFTVHHRRCIGRLGI